jgi:type I restriction enzyme S subunit
MIWTLQRLDQLGYLSRGRSKHRPRDAAHLYDGPYPRMLYVPARRRLNSLP